MVLGARGRRGWEMARFFSALPNYDARNVAVGFTAAGGYFNFFFKGSLKTAPHFVTNGVSRTATQRQS